MTATAILQQAGLRTVCLGANTYTGGMPATVEPIDGFRNEIAGSVQFPMPSQIAKGRGLDSLPTVDAEVMSANRGGTDAVAAMAGLIGWSQGPAKALGRFDVAYHPRPSSRCTRARRTRRSPPRSAT